MKPKVIIGEETLLNKAEPKNFYLVQFLLAQFIKSHGEKFRRGGTCLLI